MLSEKLVEASNRSPIVSAILRMGGGAEDCVRVLIEQNEAQLGRMVQLESLCPRKYRLPDGRTLVWRCPDELILETNLCFGDKNGT